MSGLGALGSHAQPAKGVHQPMLLEDLKGRLRTALAMTIVEEYSLFAAGSDVMPPSERAVVSQLAFRVRHVIEDEWDVDVEYGSRTTPGERRMRSPSLHLPIVASLVVHRRGRSGRDNNLLLLGLLVHGGRQFEAELQRLSSLTAAYGYQHAALLTLDPFYAAGNNPPVIVLPTWHWINNETQDPNVYSKDGALDLCRRGTRRHSLLNEESDDPTVVQLEIFPAVQGHRVEVLAQLEIRYGDWIKSDITSVVFVQYADSFALEVRTRLGGDRIERVDLSGYFEPADPVELNLAEFLRWDDACMIMLTNILDEEAARAIAVSLGYADEQEDDFLDL